MLTLTLFIFLTVVALPSVYAMPAISSSRYSVWMIVLAFLSVSTLVVSVIIWETVGSGFSPYSGLIDLTGILTTICLPLFMVSCSSLYWVFFALSLIILVVILIETLLSALLTILRMVSTAIVNNFPYNNPLLSIDWEFFFFINTVRCVYVDERALRSIQSGGMVAWLNVTIQHTTICGKRVPVLMPLGYVNSEVPDLSLCSLWVVSSCGQYLYPMTIVPSGHTIIKMGRQAWRITLCLLGHELGVTQSPLSATIIRQATLGLLSDITSSHNPDATLNSEELCLVDSYGTLYSVSAGSSSKSTIGVDTDDQADVSKSNTAATSNINAQSFWAQVFAKDNGAPTDNVFLLARRAMNNDTPITAELINKLLNFNEDEKLTAGQVEHIMSRFVERESWGSLKGRPLKGSGVGIVTGIYIVTRIDTGEVYVGSAKDLIKRLRDHASGYGTASLTRLVRSLKDEGGSSLFNVEVVKLPKNTPLHLLLAYEQIAMLMLKASINILHIASSPSRFANPAVLMGKQVFMYEDNVLRYVFNNQHEASGELEMAPTFVLRTIKNGGQYGHTPIRFSSTPILGTTVDLISDIAEVRTLFKNLQESTRRKGGPGFACYAIKGDLKLMAVSSSHMTELIATHTGKPSRPETITKHMKNGTVYRGFHIYSEESTPP